MHFHHNYVLVIELLKCFEESFNLMLNKYKTQGVKTTNTLQMNKLHPILHRVIFMIFILSNDHFTSIT